MRGSIAFSHKRRNWISRIIAWWTKGKWSHTFIVYQMEPEILVIEAGRYQVHLTTIEKYLSSKYDVVYYEPTGIDPEQVESGLRRVRGTLERSYGWLQILGFTLKGIFGKNPIRAGVICSELVLAALAEYEPGSVFAILDKDSVSPAQIEEMLRNRANWTRHEHIG